MSSANGTVFLVDDEPRMLRALERLLRAEGFVVESFDSPRRFLDSLHGRDCGCLVLDVAMPDIDGFEVKKRLDQLDAAISIVFLTGRGDIPMSVRAIKGGAVDFLTKPVERAELLRAVRAALGRACELRREKEEVAELRARFDRLTPREREVMQHVIAGELNKQTAAVLGTGEQNVKVHRARVMKKMGVRSVADLVRAAGRLGLPGRP